MLFRSPRGTGLLIRPFSVTRLEAERKIPYRIEIPWDAGGLAPRLAGTLGAALSMACRRFSRTAARIEARRFSGRPDLHSRTSLGSVSRSHGPPDAARKQAALPPPSALKTSAARERCSIGASRNASGADCVRSKAGILVADLLLHPKAPRAVERLHLGS